MNFNFIHNKKIKLIITIGIIIALVVIIWTVYRTSYTQETSFVLDENGIVWKDDGIKHGIFIGKNRNPVFAGQYAFKFYNQYSQDGNATAKQLLINNANWFVDNLTHHQNYSIYVYDFPYPSYNMPEYGWVDAMTQSRIISVLMKTHEVTGDEKYLEAVEPILNSFYVDVNDGGATYKSDDGWWFEHFAHPDGMQPKVLNAHLRVLSEIHDYYEYTKNPKAKFIFEQGLIAAKKEIHMYDNNGHTWVDRLSEPSRPNYHKIHIELTKRLYEITGEEIFSQYHEKWNSCDSVCQNWNFYYNYGLKRLGLIG